MTNLQSIRDYLLAIPAMEEEAKRLRDIYIPKSVQEAARTEWGKGVDTGVGHVLNYPNEEADSDRSRVIPITRALAILQRLEDDMVEHQVVSLGEHLWRDIRAVPIVCRFIYDDWKLIWRAVVVTLEGIAQSAFDWFFNAVMTGELSIPDVDLGQLRNAVLSAWAGLCAAILYAIGLPKLHAMISSAFKDRDKCARALRSAAFPQRHVKRFRRTRRHRT